MRDAFIEELTLLAEEDSAVMLLTGDLGFGVLTEFAEKFPNQYINVGVAEQNMSGLAAGLALEGYKVYTYSIANFTTLRCLEQIRNDICYHDVDVTLVSVGAGFSYGQLGVSHFATEDLAILRALPNMMVVAPADPWEAKILTRQMSAIGSPKYLRIDKGIAGAPEAPIEVVLGKGRVIQEGSDVTLISIGAILSESLKAAATLASHGVDARVISISTLKPLDESIIFNACHETSGIVCIEEHAEIGGLAGAISEACLVSGIIPKFFYRIGLKDEYPTIVGDQEYLRNAYNLNADNIVSVTLGALKK
ncbi:MAG: transketolase family protein [Pseudohongiellaceae bacterium]